jgi:hypothetical protein
VKSLIVAIACATPFIIFVFEPPWYDPLFLAVYVAGIFGLMMLPLPQRGISLAKTTSFYNGLVGSAGALIMISLVLSLPWGYLGQNTTKYTATSWIFLSLIAPLGSAFNVSRIGRSIREDGLDALRLQTRTRIGVQHFCLEYSSLQWFRHGKYLVLSVASTLAYLYGWSLFGVPAFLYSVALFVVTIASSRILVEKLLAPFNLSQVVAKIHSIVPKLIARTEISA